MQNNQVIKIADGLEMTVGEIVSKKVIITPKMAIEILVKYEAYIQNLSNGSEEEKQLRNRKIQPKKVQAYKRDMLKNVFNGTLNDDICFDKEGIVINGHHRLHALIEAAKVNPNITLEVFCKFNVPGDPNMDKGKTRTDMENLRMFTNIPDSLIVSHVDGAITFLAPYVGLSSGRTITEKAEIYRYFQPQLEDMVNNFKLQKVRTYSSVELFAAFFVAYLNGVPIPELQVFYDTLRTAYSTNHPCHNVIINLRQWIEKESGKNSTSVKKERYIRTLYAIKAFHEGKIHAKPGAKVKENAKTRKFDAPVYHITYNGHTF